MCTIRVATATARSARHAPDWLAERRQELLPAPRFHLVFTLPHALHGLVGQRARVIHALLFATASATLSEFAANPRWLGGTLAFSLIFHTRMAGESAWLALSVPEPDPEITVSVDAFLQRVGQAEYARRPHCHVGRFVVTGTIPPQRPPTPPHLTVRAPP